MASPPPAKRPHGEQYIERECAPLEVVYKMLKERDRPVAFLGPRGSGKTTTLKELCRFLERQGEKGCYIDAYVPNPDEFDEDADVYCVDNAQKLSCLDLSTRVTLMMMLTKKKKPIVAAFSPVIIEKDGGSTTNSPLGHCFDIYFTPFTVKELDSLKAMHPGFGTDGLVSHLPLYVSLQLDGQGEIRTRLVREVQAQLRKVRSALHNTPLIDGLLGGLLYGTSNLQESSMGRLLDAGLVYTCDGGRSCQFAYPADILRKEVYDEIWAVGGEILHFNVGVGCEYAFYTRVQFRSHKFQARCFGSKPSSLCSRNKRSDTLELTCDYQYVQANFGDVPNRSCTANHNTIVKLARTHAAVDFLIIRDSGSKSRRELYFVQVSAKKYQERPANDRLSALSRETEQLSGKSPRAFYSTKIDVDEYNCYFVYVSMKEQVSYNGDDANLVYFASLD